MHTGTKILITSFTLAIAILFCVFGCGKRTTTYEKHYIKSDSLNIQNNTELKQNYTLANIGTLRPFDNSKPIIIDGKYYYNVIIDFDKSIYSGIEIKANENLSYNGSESEIIDKETVKTDNSNLYIGLSFVVGILFVLYLALKKHNII